MLMFRTPCTSEATKSADLALDSEQDQYTSVEGLLPIRVGFVVPTCAPQVKFSEEVGVMRSAMDECLCVAYSTFKKEKVSAEEFWTLYGELGALVVRGSDVDAVLAEHSDWGAVSHELSRLTTESKLGLNMFGFAAQLLVSSTVSKVMNDGLARMSGKMLSKKSVAALKESIMSNVNEQKCLDQMPAKRLVTMTYRGLAVGRRQPPWHPICHLTPQSLHAPHRSCMAHLLMCCDVWGSVMHMHSPSDVAYLVDLGIARWGLRPPYGDRTYRAQILWQPGMSPCKKSYVVTFILGLVKVL